MNRRISSSHAAPAVVTGLCSHGLAVCRSLFRRGVTVFALESDYALPGFRSRSADVIRVPEVNGEGLIDGLVETGRRLAAASKPVLFLTNDNMVEVVGRRWQEIADFYQLSWSASREIVTRLLDKKLCEHFLRERDYPLPGTLLFDGKRPFADFRDEVAFPAIVKPSRPLGKFKAVRVDDREALSALMAAHPDTPVVIQEWIPGGDDAIYFCATVAARGKPLCFFDGAKYLSHPPARGQTVVAGPAQTPELQSLLTRFISDSNLEGPASLEAKLDPAGQYRIIEPTVGRTDFWADLAIANGIDLPYVEYLSVVAPKETLESARVSIPRVWFDSEKDPAAVARLFYKISRDLRKPWLPRFSYFDPSDLQPFWRAMANLARRGARYFRKRVF